MSSGVINIGQPDQFKGIVVKSKEPGEKRLNEQERKRMQHEFKIYMEQYFKRVTGDPSVTGGFSYLATRSKFDLFPAFLTYHHMNL